MFSGVFKGPRSLFFLFQPSINLFFSFLLPQISQTNKQTNKKKISNMGVVLKLVDAILFLFFLLIAIVAPLIDSQTCLPLSYFPDFLINVKTWYTNEYGDYLVAEKPHFFVGLVWLELLFQWPLSLINLYAMLSSKPWFNTTCLIYGVSLSTSMVFSFSFTNLCFFNLLYINLFEKN
jgi:hypothetical protein